MSDVEIWKKNAKAFPSTFESKADGQHVHMFGMDLRDYFAAKAMIEIDWYNTSTSEEAKEAYEIADAMMEERK